MKMINLLSRIHGGNGVPKKIMFMGVLYTFDKRYERYCDENGNTLGENEPLDLFLDDNVEIIED